MKLPFPALEAHLQLVHEGCSLPFTLTVDVKGIVHSGKTTIFDLPPVAQKLTLSDYDEGFPERIVARANLFQYDVALALTSNHPNGSEAFNQVVSWIHQQLNARNTSWQQLSFDKKTPGRVRYLKIGLGLTPFYNHQESIKGFSNSIAKLVLNLSRSPDDGATKEEVLEATNFIGFSGGISGQNVILDFLPAYHSSLHKYFFSALQKHRSDRAYHALIKALHPGQSEEEALPILEALLGYEYLEVEKKVNLWLSTYKGKDSLALAAAALILAQFPSNENQQFVFKTFCDHTGDYTSKLVDALLTLNCPQQEIAAAVWPIREPPYYRTTTHIVDKALTVLSKLDSKFLPGKDDIWSVFTTKIFNGEFNFTDYSSILKNLKFNDLPKRLLTVLEEPNLNFRTRNISSLLYLNNTFKASIKAIPTFSLLRVIQFNLNTNNTELRKVTIDFLAERTDLLPTDSLLDLLFENIKPPEIEADLGASFVVLLQEIFARAPYDERATSPCSILLHHQGEATRKKAIQVLSFSKDKSIKSLLLKKLKDKSAIVRRAAQTSLGLQLEKPTEEFADSLYFEEWLESPGLEAFEKELMEIEPPLPSVDSAW